MTNCDKTTKAPAWMGEDKYVVPTDVPIRDWATILLPEFDYEAQLRAIRVFLQREFNANSQLSDEINAADFFARSTTGSANRHATDIWIDLLENSVYEDATRSMAAVGMFAPFIESMFFQLFKEIGNRQGMTSELVSHNSRFREASDDAWDCHFVWEKGRRKKDVAIGIRELAIAVRIDELLPADIWSLLAALFSYRNKMFHHGLEWPTKERRSFARTIQSNEWPTDWFNKSTTAGEPRIFYLTEAYIEKFVVTLDQSFDAIGLFALHLTHLTCCMGYELKGLPRCRTDCG